MKFSNFRMIEEKGTNALDTTFLAEVDVTTGILWWKKTECRKVFKEYAGFWYFVDTGKFTPGIEIENLYRAYKASYLI